MAQTGFTPISNYYSATATNVPTAGNLVAGELAINTADGKLFYKDSAGVVQTMASKATTAGTYSSITTSNLTIGTTQLGAGNASIMKNRIINGAMVIDQRNAGASISVADANVYPIDRFIFRNATDGTATAQQSSTVPTGGGFVNSVIWTVGTADASLAAGQYSRIAQTIEGYNFADLQWGTASAKTITISFWVRSSVTGSYSVTVYNNAGDRGYAATYTISAANTWEQKTVTIAGDTSGTWLTTNGRGVTVNFGLGAGTDYSISAGSWTATSNIPLAVTGQTNLMATAGATFYITAVQLEVGSSATGFEYVNYQTSFANCQRYYETYQAGYVTGANYSTSGSQGFMMKFNVTKRATPTMAIVSGSATVTNAVAGNAGGTVAINVQPNSPSNGGDLYVSGATGLVAGNAGLLLPSSLIISYSAEL